VCADKFQRQLGYACCLPVLSLRYIIAQLPSKPSVLNLDKGKGDSNFLLLVTLVDGISVYSMPPAVTSIDREHQTYQTKIMSALLYMYLSRLTRGKADHP
jgi:hypothetical protein